MQLSLHVPCFPDLLSLHLITVLTLLSHVSNMNYVGMGIIIFLLFPTTGDSIGESFYSQVFHNNPS